MLILWLSMFIGSIQCDAADTITISPHQFDTLGVPDPNEYISIYTLSLQTSYITSVECMRSSNHYIESGFDYLDSESKTATLQIGNGAYGIENMLSELQSDQDQEIKSKLDAVVFMTVNFYMKQHIVVPKTNIKLSDLTDIISAQSVLVAQRCQSSYVDYMTEIRIIKETYLAEIGIMDYKHFSKKDWLAVVKQYNEANEKVLNQSNAYASIRDAFMLGSGINMCHPSIKIDEKMLEIYNTNDLSSFFGGIQKNASLLFYKTVTYMYSIYKNALIVIYLNSVCYSRQHVALRIMMWEQLNLVRANFEFMCVHIVKFIKEVEVNAESKFGKGSEEYNQIMIILQSTVNRMLITAILSTSVHYQRALKFHSDGDMIHYNYNKYNADDLSKFYDEIFWKISNVRSFDMRLINHETSSNPSIDMSIPINMYPLTVNKLVFQTFICQINYIVSKMQKMESDITDSNAWLFTQVTLKEMEYSILFAKCSVIGNKIYSINAATYAYVMLTQATSVQKEGTTQGSEFEQIGSSDTSENGASTEVAAIMDHISIDIIGVLCVHSVEIIQTCHKVEVYIIKNTKTTAFSTNYQPGITSNENENYYTPPQQNTGNTQKITNNINNNGAPIVSDNNVGTFDIPTSNIATLLAGAPVSNNDNLSGTSDDITASTMKMESSNNEMTTGDTYHSITSTTQITERLKFFQASVTLAFSSCMELVQSAKETEYTKLVMASLQSSQDQFNINHVYLNLIVTESEKYISKITAPGSSEYLTAITALFRDTMEKQIILRSLIEVPLSRVNSFDLDLTDYLYVPQTVEYTIFIKTCYKYFGVDYTQLFDSNYNANLFLTKSVSVFTQIHEAIMKTVQETNESPYTKFLKWYLELTLIAFKMTCESIRNQIKQSQAFISQRSQIKQIEFYKEITLHVETVCAIYFPTYIKCHQYATGNSSAITFQSDYEVVVSQLSFST